MQDDLKSCDCETLLLTVEALKAQLEEQTRLCKEQVIFELETFYYEFLVSWLVFFLGHDCILSSEHNDSTACSYLSCSRRINLSLLRCYFFERLFSIP